MGTVNYALVDTAEPEQSSESTDSPHRVRIVDAALACLTRKGLARTTLDDVARQAGVSRATIYRVFPGGKDTLMQAVGETEIARFMSALAVRMGAASDLESTLVAGITEAARRIQGHTVLKRLLTNEPGVILPRIAFAQMDDVLRSVSALTAPFLARWMDGDEAVRIAEWSARIVISYTASPAVGLDVSEEDGVRRLVRTFVLPGIHALRHPGPRNERDEPHVRHH